MAALTRRPLVLVLAALALALGACASAPAPGPSQTAGSASVAPSASASRHTGVSEHETAALAAELVPLVGVTYQDVPAAELAAQLGQLPDDISAASYHSVIDSTTHREIAFLSLLVVPPADAMNSAAYSERVARSVLGTQRPTKLTFGGQPVWYAEDPSTPASRYTYTWLRHGTEAWVDGPDRATVENFLTAYFASGFRGAESDLLSARMVDLPGFSFTNAVDRSREVSAVSDALPGTEATMHYVFDATHSMGGLVLAGPVPDGTSDVAAATAWFTTVYDLPASGVRPLADRTIAGVTVHQFQYAGYGMSVFVWTWPDTHVTGWLLTNRPDIATTFLDGFVAATPAT